MPQSRKDASFKDTCYPRDAKRRLWTSIFALPLAAYVFAEACIYSGMNLTFLRGLHPYGLINAYEASSVRKTELATHFACQLMLLPVIFLRLLSAVVAYQKIPTIKNALQGAFLALVMSAFLFIPHYGEPSPPEKRQLFITPLIREFNFAYALNNAFFVFILALGMTLVAAWMAKFTHSKLRQKP